MIILDVRVPCTPVARLNNHRACVNGIAWAPHSSCHICTAGDDHQVCMRGELSSFGLVWFGFITGSCERQRLKVQFAAHQTSSMTDSMAVATWLLLETLAPVSWKMILLPSVRCPSDIDTAPGLFSSPEVLRHQQIVEYWIPPFGKFSDKTIYKQKQNSS